MAQLNNLNFGSWWLTRKIRSILLSLWNTIYTVGPKERFAGITERMMEGFLHFKIRQRIMQATEEVD